MEKQADIKAIVKNENTGKVKQLGKELVCEACEQDRVQKPAAAFCVDCQDYLCAECSGYHCIPKPTKHHKVLFQDEMPKRKASTSLSEDCAKHKGETVKFYCKNHQVLCCNTCVATVHRTCVSVCAISDFTNDVEMSPIYNGLKQELKEMEQLFKTQQERIKEKDKLSKQCYKDTLVQLRKRRLDVKKQFDKLEQNIKVESSRMSKEDTVKMEHLNNLCADKIDALDEIKSDLDLLEETKQQKQLFIAITKANLKVSEMKASLLKIKANTIVREFQLFPNELSNSLALREDSLGQLEICESENVAQTGLQKKYEQVGLSKLVEMLPNKIVSTEYQKCRVALYFGNFVKKGSLKFPTGPWDLTRTADDIVAVTFPHEKKIKFLYIDDRIQEVGHILSPGHCMGIAAVNNNLVVTFSNPYGINILSSTGELIKNISMNTNLVQLKKPAYAAVDEDNNIFVTDPEMNVVARININGSIVGCCRAIKRPLHVCVQNRNVFVTECDVAVVHILNTDLKIVETDDSFYKEFLGDFSISQGGIAFQGIFKLRSEDFCASHETGHAVFANVAKFNNSTKKCVIV